MKYEIAKRAMSLVAQASTGVFESLGISRKDFDTVTGAIPWLATDRVRVRAVLDTMIYASVDLIGVPRFELCAEYIAAALGIFVHPVNLMVACRFMEGSSQAEVLSQDSLADPVTARQLHALVIRLHTSESAISAREQFSDAVGVKIAFARAREDAAQQPKKAK